MPRVPRMRHFNPTPSDINRLIEHEHAFFRYKGRPPRAHNGWVLLSRRVRRRLSRSMLLRIPAALPMAEINAMIEAGRLRPVPTREEEGCGE